MSAWHQRWKVVGYGAELAAVLVFALIVAPRFPFPKPVFEAPRKTKPQHGNWIDLHPTPLGDDLERGRWKSGDSVEDVLVCYSETIEVRKHGEFTTITEHIFNGRSGFPQGHYETVAIRGRLKAAGKFPGWVLRPKNGDPLRYSYFDTLTKEERAAHDASYKRALAISYAKSPSGTFAFCKAFMIGPGKLSGFGR